MSAGPASSETSCCDCRDML